MTTLRKMADRSDRREEKPITRLGSQARATDWLPTRGFHFGQEMPGSLRTNALHLQAGDTTAVLTHCHEPLNNHRKLNADARGHPEDCCYEGQVQMIRREAVEAAGADGVVGTLRSALDSLEPTAPWNTVPVFHSSLDALRSPGKGDSSTASTAAPTGSRSPS